MDDLDFRRQWSFQWAGPEELDILERDAARTTRQASAHPGLLAIRDAQGAYVEDHGGRRYLDLHGNNCHHIGYRHPKLVKALTQQLQSLTSNTRGFTNGVFVEFAERLSDLWSGHDARVFLVPGGAGAVELALAIARVHTGRYKTISFDDCFHGRSLAAIGLSAVSRERSPRLGPLLPGVLHVPSFKLTALAKASGVPDVEMAAQRSLDAIAEQLRREHDVGCLIAEAIGNGGYRPPHWYWREIRKLCDEHSVLLIFDDVPLGLGKTGALFNAEHFGIVPDMCVLGKSLGGAMLPAAAFLVGGHLDTAPELDLGYFTHEKNPMVARAALATLEVLLEENLVERSRSMGVVAFEALRTVAQRHSLLVGDIRNAGLMLSFDLNANEHDESAQSLTRDIFFHAMQEGLILNYSGYGSTLRMSFPLIVSEEDVELGFQRLDRVLEHCANERH